MGKTRCRARKAVALAVLWLVLVQAMVRVSIAAGQSSAAVRAGNVRDYGARGDGATDDTKAVQTAIDACSAKGEKLVFPAGTYLTGTVYLRSHTAIELMAKAVWKGIGRVEAYPMQRPRGFDGRMVSAWRAMIYAEDVENITLTNMLIEIEGGLPAQEVTVPENSRNYPYNRIFGQKLPAYAFFVRHAQNVQFRDIQVKTLNADERRAFIFEDATGMLDHVDIANPGGPGMAPVVVDKAEAISLRGSNLGIKVEVRPK